MSHPPTVRLSLLAVAIDLASCSVQASDSRLSQTCGFDLASVGRPVMPEGRLAYWCVADCYRRIARQLESASLSDAAKRTAGQYERAAPSANAVAALGLRSGDRVDIGLSDAGSCATTVR